MSACTVLGSRRWRLAVLFFVGGCLPLLVATAHGADEAVSQFGKLPARFNGRVGTMDAAARALLLRLSFRDTAYNDDGREYSAVEWFLNELAAEGKATGTLVFSIPNADVRKFAGLKDRSADGPLQNRYSYEEIEPWFDKMAEALEKTAGENPERDRAMRELVETFRSYLELRLSLQTPPLGTVEEREAAGQRAADLDVAALPELVRMNEPGQGWISWAKAIWFESVAATVQGVDGLSLASYGHLQKIFAARRQQDTAALADAVQAYATYLKKQPFPPAPFDFELPPTWQELGVSVDNYGSYYDDVRSSGAPVAVFACNSADNSALPQVIYFPATTCSAEQTFNHWRMQIGLAPLPDADLRRTLTTIDVNGKQGAQIDVTEPGILGHNPPLRILATIFRREQDTLVVQSIGSPEAVETEKANYDAFVKSLKWGEPAALKEWFALKEGDPKPTYFSYSFVIATVKKGEHVWFFRCGGNGALPDDSRKLLYEFIEKFEPAPFLGGGDPSSWMVPARWQAAAPTDAPVNFEIADGDDRYRFLSAMPLAEYTAASELPLLNNWRTAVELPAWTAAEAAQGVKTVKIGGAEVRIAEFVGAPDPSPPPQAPPAPAPPAPPAPPKT